MSSEKDSGAKEPRIMDQVREVMRLHHYSIHTERTYCDWIARYIRFHKMASWEDLQGGEAKIEQFLTHLAVDTDVSSATQNLAMNALVFLYKKVLKIICISRTWPTGVAGFICRRHCPGNSAGPTKNGYGSMCFRRQSCPLIREAAWSAAIISIPVRSIKPSRPLLKKRG